MKKLLLGLILASLMMLSFASAFNGWTELYDSKDTKRKLIVYAKHHSIHSKHGPLDSSATFRYSNFDVHILVRISPLACFSTQGYFYSTGISDHGNRRDDASS